MLCGRDLSGPQQQRLGLCSCCDADSLANRRTQTAAAAAARRLLLLLLPLYSRRRWYRRNLLTHSWCVQLQQLLLLFALMLCWGCCPLAGHTFCSQGPSAGGGWQRVGGQACLIAAAEGPCLHTTAEHDPTTTGCHEVEYRGCIMRLVRARSSCRVCCRLQQWQVAFRDAKKPQCVVP
jgi:hypothetical protein